MMDWLKTASKLLVGRTIVGVDYISEEERDQHYLAHRAIVLRLDNGLEIFPMADEEGNDAGCLFTTDRKVGILPRL